MESYQKLASEMEKQIKNWQKQVASMQTMIPNMDGDMKKQFDAQLQTMQDNMNQASEQLAELQSVNQDAWKDIEQGAMKAFEQWQKGWLTAMSRYSK